LESISSTINILLNSLPTQIQLEATNKKLDDLEKLWGALDRHLAINNYVLAINSAKLLNDKTKIPSYAASMNIELEILEDTAAPQLKNYGSKHMSLIMENGVYWTHLLRGL